MYIQLLQVDKASIAFTVGLVAIILAVIAVLSSDNLDIVLVNTTTPELLAKQTIAYQNFLERNNFHQIRISEYAKYWGDASSDQKLDTILGNIKLERELVDKFDLASKSDNGWSEIREKFRHANDMAVAGLVDVLFAEYDRQLLHIPKVSSPDIMKTATSLAAQKDIASQITSTSFPTVTKDLAELAHITQLETKNPKYDIITATKTLDEQTEANIKILEENDIDTRQRHNIMEVGPDKNTIQVLYSVIQCQQELRINAEDYMDATLAINLQNYN